MRLAGPPFLAVALAASFAHAGVARVAQAHKSLVSRNLQAKGDILDKRQDQTIVSTDGTSVINYSNGEGGTVTVNGAQVANVTEIMHTLNATQAVGADGLTTYVVNGTEVFKAENTTIAIVPGHTLLFNGTVAYDLVNGTVLEPISLETYKNLTAPLSAFQDPFFTQGFSDPLQSIPSRPDTWFSDLKKRFESAMKGMNVKRDIFIDMSSDTVASNDGGSSISVSTNDQGISSLVINGTDYTKVAESVHAKNYTSLPGHVVLSNGTDFFEAVNATLVPISAELYHNYTGAANVSEDAVTGAMAEAFGPRFGMPDIDLSGLAGLDLTGLDALEKRDRISK